MGINKCKKCGMIDDRIEAGEETCIECHLNETLPQLEGTGKQIEYAKTLRLRNFEKLIDFINTNENAESKTRQLLVAQAREKLTAIKNETSAGKIISLLK